MCGISGIISINKLTPKDEATVLVMNSLLTHRGPNDSGFFSDKNCILGQTRLSIIDLTTDGHQPFFSDDGRFVMIYNGEIYNYLELKERLIGEGVSFKTKSDTEVLLKAYIAWGKEFLHQLNGMFAFVIYDRESEYIFIARDRFGVKPFYYYYNGGVFKFSSEIEPILKTEARRFLADDQMIYDYLVFNRTNHTEKTFFQDIIRLEHGSSLGIFKDKIEIQRWYTLKDHLEPAFENADQVRDMLIDAIRIRMRSDVPVGISLSGGVDSSSIAGILTKTLEFKNLNSFSAIYNTNHRSNEKEFIDSFTEKTFKKNFVYPSAESLDQDLYKFVKLIGEPVPTTSIYAYYKVYERAQKDVTVMLDGQGADESLGGYSYFIGYFYKDLIKNWKLLTFLKVFFVDLIKLKSFEGILFLFFFLISDTLKNSLLKKKINYLGDRLVMFTGSSEIISKLWNAPSLKEAFLFHFEYKMEHLLMWGDKTSMANSIEVRYPFLDYRFVQRAVGIQADKLFFDGYNKFILREAVRQIVPAKILDRRLKVGFETPEAEWFREKIWETKILDILESDTFQNRGYVNPEKAKKMYKAHLAGKKDYSNEIWKWINLELWFREFID